MYEVVKDMPIVKPTTSNSMYPWDEITEIGMGFYIRKNQFPEGDTAAKVRTRVYNAAREHGRKNGKRFKAYITEEGDVAITFVELKDGESIAVTPTS